MKLSLKEAKEVQDAYGKNIKITYIEEFVYEKDGGQGVIENGATYNVEHNKIFEGIGIREINVAFTERLYAALIQLYPEKFRKPYTHKSFLDIDRIMAAFRDFNTKSKRERYIKPCTEIYEHTNDGKTKVVIEFDMKLTPDKWNQLKSRIGDKNKEIPFRYSECGIIVLVDLTPGGKDYLKRFYKNTDLITTLVGPQGKGTINAPDFIGSYDVIQVDDPKKLLQKYQESNARLIIVGDTPDESYAKALKEVKAYDRFARFAITKKVDISKKEEFLKMMSRTYNSDNWDLKGY